MTTGCRKRIPSKSFAVTAQPNSLTAGVPSTFNFRNDKRNASEVDMMIASYKKRPDKNELLHQMQVPLYKGVKEEAVLLDLSNDVTTRVGDGTYIDKDNPGFDKEWAASWKGYNPAERYVTYKVEWLPDKVIWYAGIDRENPEKRIMFEKKNDAQFPVGPLP